MTLICISSRKVEAIQESFSDLKAILITDLDDLRFLGLLIRLNFSLCEKLPRRSLDLKFANWVSIIKESKVGETSDTSLFVETLATLKRAVESLLEWRLAACNILILWFDASEQRNIKIDQKYCQNSALLHPSTELPPRSLLSKWSNKSPLYTVKFVLDAPF